MRNLFGKFLGSLYIVFLVIGNTAMFLIAMSALWGWYALALIQCVILVAIIFDKRAYYKEVLLGRTTIPKGEKFFARYLLGLVVIAVAFNIFFVLMYLLGIYAPPFGDVWIRK